MMSSRPVGDMQITTDGGLTWRSVKSQCAGNPFRGNVATSDGIELWELCTGYPDATTNDADKTLLVSEDGGKSWKQRATALNGGALEPSGVPVCVVSNQARVAFTMGAPTPLVAPDAGSAGAPVSLTGTG